MTSWRLESVCPWPSLPTLDGYAPSMGWQADAASEGQLRALARFGLALREGLSKGEASYLIDRCLEYEAAIPDAGDAQAGVVPAPSCGLWEQGMGVRPGPAA